MKERTKSTRWKPFSITARASSSTSSGRTTRRPTTHGSLSRTSTNASNSTCTFHPSGPPPASPSSPPSNNSFPTTSNTLAFPLPFRGKKRTRRKRVPLLLVLIVTIPIILVIRRRIRPPRRTRVRPLTPRKLGRLLCHVGPLCLRHGAHRPRLRPIPPAHAHPLDRHGDAAIVLPRRILTLPWSLRRRVLCLHPHRNQGERSRRNGGLGALGNNRARPRPRRKFPNDAVQVAHANTNRPLAHPVHPLFARPWCRPALPPPHLCPPCTRPRSSWAPRPPRPALPQWNSVRGDGPSNPTILNRSSLTIPPLRPRRRLLLRRASHTRLPPRRMMARGRMRRRRRRAHRRKRVPMRWSPSIPRSWPFYLCPARQWG